MYILELHLNSIIFLVLGKNIRLIVHYAQVILILYHYECAKETQNI